MSEKENNLDELNDIDNLLDDDLQEWEGITKLGDLKMKKIKISKLNKIFIWVLFFMLILFWLIYSVFYYFKLNLDNSRSEFGNTYLKYVNTYIVSHFSNVSIWWTSIFDDNNKNVFKRAQHADNYITNPTIIFYEKTDQKKYFLKKSISKIKTNLAAIKSTEGNIVKYKYINKKLKGLIRNTKIMPILTTLNAIKLYFTDYVFIKLWTFNNNVLNDAIQNKVWNDSSLSWILSSNKQMLENYIMEDVKIFWAQWIRIYLKDIVFNYMYSNNANGWVNIWWTVFVTNFEQYFKKELNSRYLSLVKDWFSLSKKKFEKDYINLFEWIYSNTKKFLTTANENFLPINIQLLNYNAKNQTLSFSIKIALWANEEKYTNWNVSVISLATDIITLLRESRLIIWKYIKANNFKVYKIVRRVAWQKIVQNTINLNFSTSVQSSVNIEVTDSNK